MTHMEELKESTRKMLPDWVNDNDLTACVDEIFIFLTHVFEDGEVMGFWSHSPWGRVHNQEQGWIVANEDGIILDCVTRSTFSETGSFRAWRRGIKTQFGVATKLCDEFTGEQFWKLSET